MILAHKIALDPTMKQSNYFASAAGCARFVWNWALEAWNAEYKAGGRPNAMALKKRFNALKYAQYPWMEGIHRDAHSQPFANLQKAWNGFFKKTRGRPKFHKNGRKDSFYIANDKFAVEPDGKHVRLPVIGSVRIREKLRFEGKIMGAVVSRTAQRWFISIQVEVENRHARLKRTGNDTVGIDLGIKAAATMAGDSGIETLHAPRPLRRALKKLRRLERQKARRKIGCSNRRKTVRRISRVHARVANIRRDFWSKITTKLCRKNQAVGIETLNVKGMLGNRKLSRAISDVAFYMPKAMLEYKSKLYSTNLVKADPWYPSSKTCSQCGHVKDSLPLSELVFRCNQCEHVQDRDANAARNLCQLAQKIVLAACEKLTPGDSGDQGASPVLLDEPGTKPWKNAGGSSGSHSHTN